MWKFDAATDAILVKFDQLRYRLLPYIYSSAWQVTHANDSMMRPLVMDFRTDTQAVGVPDQYLFGRELMVNPVVTQGATSRGVYLPAGQDWYDFWTGDRAIGGQTVDASAPIDSLPLYVRAGSILPMGPVVNYAGEKPAAPLELRIYRGADGAFTLYEDEDDNYNYEHGVHATIPLLWSEKSQTLTIGKRDGRFPGMPTQREFRVVFVSPNHGAGRADTGNADAEVTYKGGSLEIPFH